MKKLILLSLCLFGCKKEKQPQIGKLYTHSFSYLDSFENPFEAIKIDTLIVLDVKENYVLYQFNNGYKRSDKITWFNKVTKKIE